MHGQRIAGEDDVDETVTNQLGEVLDTSGVDDHGAGDHRNATTGLLHVTHHRGDAGHAAFHPTFGRDVVAHEREAEAIPFLELRRYPNALVPADDRFAGADVTQLAARRPRTRDHDDGVHPLLFHLHPLAADADMGAMVGRRVEIVRHAAILFRRLDQRVALAYGVTA